MKPALKRIGPYEVLGIVGEGGMGRVYRARDQRLGRHVAVKVLPDELREDAGRLRRFQREARAIGALSHPNILTVHDVGEADGAPYLVTELLEGETLRDRLARGPLVPAEAIDSALQVARGLSVAHDNGIVHRDLKPSNLFVCEDGFVKILDFGIAKQQRSGDATEPETVATREGSPIGSVGYMAPEQIRGRPVDARTDLFALGIVLFEMVAGARPFGGDTDVEVAIATLQEEPPELGDGKLDDIVRRCLAKPPDERYASARDLAADLEALAANAPAAVEVRVAPARAVKRREGGSRVWIAAAAALALAGGGAGMWMMRGGDAEPAAKAQPGQELRENRITMLPDPVWRHAISRDGASIAYWYNKRAYIRPVAGGYPEPVPAPDNWELFPVDFFPDGHRVLFGFHDAEIDAGGFVVVELHDGSRTVIKRGKDFGLGARLSPDGRRLAFTAPDGIRTMTATGEDERLLVPGDAANANMSAMSWSPDASHLVYIHVERSERGVGAKLVVVAADGSRSAELPAGDFVQSEDVVGVEWFDEHRIVYGHTSGEPTGSELWEIGVRDGEWDGEPARRVFRFALGRVDHFRRGGDRLFFIKNIVNPDIYRLELGPDGTLAGEPRAVEFFDADDNLEDVTPAGDLLFASNRNGTFDVFRRKPDGTVEVVAGTNELECCPRAAGEAVLYVVATRENRSMYRAEPGGEKTRLLTVPHGGRLVFYCARTHSDRCVITQREGEDAVVRRFDPRTGEAGEEIYRHPDRDVYGGMVLDASGERGALALTSSAPTVAVVDVATGEARTVKVDAPSTGHLFTRWMPDGRLALVGVTTGIPYWVGIAELSGEFRELWRTQNGLHMPPVPSPDGTSIALTVNVLDIETWAIDGL